MHYKSRFLVSKGSILLLILIKAFILIGCLNPIEDKYLSVGHEKYSLKEYKDAILYFDKAIKLNPELIEAYKYRGASKYFTDNYKGAIADFDFVINAVPDDDFSLFLRGDSKVLLHDYNEGFKDYADAIRVNPNNRSFYNRRAEIRKNLKNNDTLYKIKDYESAKSVWLSAFKINPFDSIVHVKRRVLFTDSFTIDIEKYKIRRESFPDFSKSKVSFNSVKFGDIEIVLPIIDGMIECYFDDRVKELVNMLELVDNKVLACYLNLNVYNEISKIKEISFDDYILIFSPAEAINESFSQDDLKMLSHFEKNELNWIDIIDLVSEKSLYEFKLDSLVMIDSYQLNTDVITSIYLTKSHDVNEDNFMLISYNYVLIKNKLIFLTYYKFYQEKNCLEIFKKKNDDVVLFFMKENKS